HQMGTAARVIGTEASNSLADAAVDAVDAIRRGVDADGWAAPHAVQHRRGLPCTAVAYPPSASTRPIPTRPPDPGRPRSQRSAEADPAEPRSTVLHHALPGLVTAVQCVDDAPRFHLDIETDDVDAETARLVLLGAAEVAREHGRRVLRTPGGHVVCIVPVRSD